MAAIKGSTQKRADGRARAVRLLSEMDRANEGFLPGDLKSREILHDGLSDFLKLNADQKRRFVAVLNHYIGTAMQGAIVDVGSFRNGTPEVQAMRVSNKVLREEGRAS